MPAPVRVVLVIAHDIIRGGAKAVLEEDGDIRVVAGTAGVTEGLRAVADLTPDVVVVAPELPDGSGIDLIARIREEAPGAHALVLAPDDEPPHVLAALNGGASAYLRKRVDGATFRGTVRALAEGRAAIDPELFQRVLAHVEQPRGPHQAAGLNAQQQRILELIGQGLTNREIGEQLFLAEKTVKNHVTRILAVLGVRRRTQAALVANHARS